MRKEDLKRPQKEDKLDLIKERIFLNLLLFLVLASNLKPQIPLNGFCNYSVDNSGTGYNILVDLTKPFEKIPRFVAFSELNGELTHFLIDKDATVTQKKRQFTPFNVAKAISSKFLTGGNSKIFFITEKANHAGLIYFDDNGIYTGFLIETLESTPENISEGIVFKNKESVFLLSGVGYNGLTLLTPRDNGFTKKNILSGSAFSNAIFIDLNHNGFDDIAAYNLTAGNLEFYFNDGSGNFNLIRSIPGFSTVKNLIKVDFDKDGYNDFIITSGKNVTIFFGDPLTSYKKTITIELKQIIETIELADFNGDGNSDIAYFGLDRAAISIVLQKSPGLFFDEFKILKNGKYRNITTGQLNGSTFLASFTESGSLEIISKLNQIRDLKHLVFPGKPANLGVFNDESSQLPGIAYTDISEKSFNIILNNSKGIPEKFIRFQLQQHKKRFLVTGINSEQIAFIFYDFGDNAVELMRMNLKTLSINRNVYYLKGALREIKLGNNLTSGNAILNIICRSKQGLIFSKLEISTNNINEKSFQTEIQNSVYTVAGNFNDFFVWTSKKDSLVLKKVSFGLAGGSNQIISVATVLSQKLKCFTIPDIKSNTDAFISIEENKNNSLTFDKDKFSVKRNSSLIQPEFSKLKFPVHSGFEKLNSMFLLNTGEGLLYLIETNANNVIFNPAERLNNPGDFTVIETKSFGRAVYYINEANGIIEFKKF
ncbi:MAG: VCBS repeat-containing protein [Ignavibacteriaceae bacterium]|nr:VCBS repeat-containing protein [Ignavibacteriaceae bacterium]